MIKKITLENFLSFGNRQIIDLTNSNNIFSIIGHNSSGKSNIIKALNFLKYFVVNSFKSNPKILLAPNYNKFKSSSTTTIEIEFLLLDKMYTYLINYDKVVNQEILKENNNLVFSLQHTYSKEEKEKIDNLKNGDDEIITSSTIEYSVADRLSSEVKKILEFKRPNASLISTAQNLNIAVFEIIYKFFDEKIQIFDNANTNFFSDKKFVDIMKTESSKNQILKLIKFVDKEIDDVKPISKKVKSQRVQLTFDSDSLSIPSIEDVDEVIEEIYFVKDNKEFKFTEESHGVTKILQLIHHLLPNLEEGGTLIIDELETGINPRIYKYLLDLFTNHYKSQLIFTTHNLLFLDYLKSNQICLVEKIEHESQVTLLDKFYDDENVYHNFLRDYMVGKLTLSNLKETAKPINDSWLKDE